MNITTPVTNAPRKTEAAMISGSLIVTLLFLVLKNLNRILAEKKEVIKKTESLISHKKIFIRASLKEN